MSGTLWRSLALAVASAAVLGGLHLAGVGLPLLIGLAVVIGVVAWMLPAMGVSWLDEIVLFVRGLFWAPQQGRFHSFGGIPLQIEDDGRQVWIDGAGLQRVLGRREPEDVLAARLSGAWRRDARGALMLRVPAVVQHLATMPGRDDPRVQRLRRYLEREVLYPASRRRARDRGS